MKLRLIHIFYFNCNYSTIILIFYLLHVTLLETTLRRGKNNAKIMESLIKWSKQLQYFFRREEIYRTLLHGKKSQSGLKTLLISVCAVHNTTATTSVQFPPPPPASRQYSGIH